MSTWPFQLRNVRRRGAPKASALRTWPIVAFGFGAMLFLGGVITVVTLNRIQRMHQSVLNLTDANQSRRRHVDALRSQVYASSILIRDYLLDEQPERLNSYKAKLQTNRESALAQLSQLKSMSSPRSDSTLQSLVAEVQAYWLSLDSLIQAKETDARTALYDHVRTFLIPRRQAVITLAEELADLNDSEARLAREDVDRSIREFQHQSLLLRIFTMLVAAGMAIFTTTRVLNLERASRAERIRVERAEAEMRKLSQELLTSQEKERRLLSRELHDDVGQVLTGLRFGLVDLEQHCVAPTPKFSDTLTNCRSMLEQTIESIRSMAMGLRPSMLDDLGLGAAIEWQAREFSRRFDIPVIVSVDPEAANCPEPERTALYRVLQEALTNCARHAQPKSIRVELLRSQDSLKLAVIDDGVGVRQDKHKRGFGLVGMEERVREIGGDLRVSSAPNAGTTLEVRVPFAGVTAGG